MKTSNFTEEQVEQVSKFLQDYMAKNGITELTADECATILAKAEVLPNDVGPKPGFNFRQMLRDGRDGLVPMVSGGYQEAPNRRWHISRTEI